MIAIAALHQMLQLVGSDAGLSQFRTRLETYRARYGVLAWLAASGAGYALVAARCGLRIAGGGNVRAQRPAKWVDENGKGAIQRHHPAGSKRPRPQELRADGTLKRETERAATIEEKRLAAQARCRRTQGPQAAWSRAQGQSAADHLRRPEDFDRVRDRALGNLETGSAT